MLSFSYFCQILYKTKLTFLGLSSSEELALNPPPKGMSKELVEFLDAVPDYRRTDRGHIVHPLRDMLLLELMARLAK